MPSGAFDVGVGDAREAFARFAVRFAWRVVDHTEYRTMIRNVNIIMYIAADNDSYRM
jgi:hypothetical protein